MKGQAAMEYLMTYGWAILIVIAVVAALYAMGVFRVGGGTVPCSPCFSYFAFVDYGDTNGDGTKDTLVIRNGPKSINITDVTVGGTSIGFTQDLITPGDKITIPGVSPGDITITYVDNDSGLTHTDTATLH